MSVVTFDFGGPLDLSALCRTAHDIGYFSIRHPLFPSKRCADVIRLAAEFFALPLEQKRTLSIEASSHFRGYSEMRNERDWREQIHFGREEQPVGGTPAWGRLIGPNLWPEDPHWRGALLGVMADFETVGREVLSALGEAVGLRGLMSASEEPYLLLKLIHYLIPPGGTPRSGVAPHVDFSWLTLLLQDDTGGLEVRTPDGSWHSPVPEPGTLVVHIGEILQFATSGYYLATPHRVITKSATRSRVSLPFFLNPSLDRLIEQQALGWTRTRWPIRESDPRDPAHVHRVFALDRREEFVFGDEEWRRKGQGVWCRACVNRIS